MRNVAAWLFITLDGVTESPDKWQGGLFDDDMLADVSSQIAAEDAIVMGRVTYQDFESYWPNATDEPFASHINKTPKYVVSTTLDSVTWGDWEAPTLIKGNLPEEITRLKGQPGRNIGVSGSPTLVRSLLQENLLDELKLMIHPVVVSRGKRLFEQGMDLKKLKLVDSKTTGTGVVILTYKPVRTEGEK